MTNSSAPVALVLSGLSATLWLDAGCGGRASDDAGSIGGTSTGGLGGGSAEPAGGTTNGVGGNCAYYSQAVRAAIGDRVGSEVLALAVQGSDLRGLECLPNLEELSVSFGSNALLDLSPLADSERLLRLELISPPNDVSALKLLPDLKHLRLLGPSQLSDLGPLESLKALETLELSGLSLETFEPLRNLATLQKLGIFDCPLKDSGSRDAYEFLGFLRDLESLTILWPTTPLDFAHLAKARHLNSISMWGPDLVPGSLALLAPPEGPPGRIALDYPGDAETMVSAEDLLAACSLGWCVYYPRPNSACPSEQMCPPDP